MMFSRAPPPSVAQAPVAELYETVATIDRAMPPDFLLVFRELA
jgi:hypothetical protein